MLPRGPVLRGVASSEDPRLKQTNQAALKDFSAAVGSKRAGIQSQFPRQRKSASLATACRIPGSDARP